MRLPTPAEEAADAAAAARSYAQAVAALREDTRDSARFPLIAAENADYGLRRNLLGLRGFGVAIALVVLVACIATFALDPTGSSRLTACGVPFVYAACLLAIFLVVVTPDWPRTPADAYAERLLGSAGSLARRTPTQPTEIP
jgi:hypothetical protein